MEIVSLRGGSVIHALFAGQISKRISLKRTRHGEFSFDRQMSSLTVPVQSGDHLKASEAKQSLSFSSTASANDAMAGGSFRCFPAEPALGRTEWWAEVNRIRLLSY
jgi:hypothetical protein